VAAAASAGAAAAEGACCAVPALRCIMGIPLMDIMVQNASQQHSGGRRLGAPIKVHRAGVPGRMREVAANVWKLCGHAGVAATLHA